MIADKDDLKSRKAFAGVCRHRPAVAAAKGQEEGTCDLSSPQVSSIAGTQLLVGIEQFNTRWSVSSGARSMFTESLIQMVSTCGVRS